jgi:hypothetical protein
MVGQSNENIFEDGIHDAEFIRVSACASNLGLQPAQNILSLILPDADVQSISERLNVFHVHILVCHMTKNIYRRAAQFKDSSVEARPQIRRRILRDDFSILHESHSMTA